MQQKLSGGRKLLDPFAFEVHHIDHIVGVDRDTQGKKKLVFPRSLAAKLTQVRSGGTERLNSAICCIHNSQIARGINYNARGILELTVV